MPIDREKLARHIADDVSYFAREARAAGLDSLAYLLEMAWMEAVQHTGRSDA